MVIGKSLTLIFTIIAILLHNLTRAAFLVPCKQISTYDGHFKNPRTSPSPLVTKSKINNEEESNGWLAQMQNVIQSDPKRAISFSVAIAACGAILGPFLDSYHSAFGVLQYDLPISFRLWGQDELHPALTTAWWVPELFGLAGFIIGWLYILLDHVLKEDVKTPSPPLISVGISYFTFQYWLSGVMFQLGYDRTIILAVMTILCTLGYFAFDRTLPGFLTSLATAVGGPLIEVMLISNLTYGGYHYSDSGETRFFPLWIAPVYFLGGPAVGNLARGIWNKMSETSSSNVETKPNCKYCNDSRAVPCPCCDGMGDYVTYNRRVQCNCCKGRGLVICRECFDDYNDPPNDIEAIREFMSRIPD